MRQNTGGEFPPGSGMKWLGVQFNASDILGNVYAGKKKLPNGKTKTVRIYCGRWKEMVPCLERIAEKLGEALSDPQYQPYVRSWDLNLKWERAKKQLAVYRNKVSLEDERAGLAQLKIEPKKAKRQSSSERDAYRIKRENFGDESGRLVGFDRKRKSEEMEHGLYYNQYHPTKRMKIEPHYLKNEISDAFHNITPNVGFVNSSSAQLFDFAPVDSWTNDEIVNFDTKFENGNNPTNDFVVPKGFNNVNNASFNPFGPLEALHQILGTEDVNVNLNSLPPTLNLGWSVPKFERQPSIEDLLASDDDCVQGAQDFLTAASDNEDVRNQEEIERLTAEKAKNPWKHDSPLFVEKCVQVNAMIKTYMEKISDEDRRELEYLTMHYSYPEFNGFNKELLYLSVSSQNFGFIASQFGTTFKNLEDDDRSNYYINIDRLNDAATVGGFLFLKEVDNRYYWSLNQFWVPLTPSQIISSRKS